MTVPPSSPALRAPRSARPPRPSVLPRIGGDPRGRWRRRVGAVLAAVLITLAPVLPAHAADPTPSPAPTLSGRLDATVSSAGNGVIEPGSALTVWVSEHNGTAYALAASDVAVAVGTEAITSRAALSAWLDGSTARSDLTTVATTTIDAVDSGGSGRALATVTADNPVLTGLAPGVHALSATIKGAANTRTVTGTMVVDDPANPSRTPLGLVVPITAPPITTGLLTVADLTRLTAPAGGLTAQLNAVAGTSAILAVDPAIPAAIRALGTAAPSTATDWLNRLMALPNERFALQFGDADLAVQTRTGHGALLAPTTLQPYMAAANFPPGSQTAPTPASTPTATPTTAPNQPVFPSLTALEAVGTNTRNGVYWPFSGSAGAKDVAALGALAAAPAPSLTLIPSDSTTIGSGGGAVPARGASGTAGVLVYDAAASAALRDASMQDDPIVRGSSLAAASAYLALVSHATAGAPVLAVVDRSATRSALGLSAAIDAATHAPGTTPATLASLTAAAPDAVTVKDAPAETARSAALGAFTDGEVRIGAFASILDDPTLLTGSQRAEILQLLGGGWIEDAPAWRTAVSAHEKATRTTLAAVSIAPSSTINLAGTAAPLRFGVRNDLPWPVTVTLIAHPDDLRLEVQGTTAVTAQARSTTRVAVPVHARIGNGQVSMDLQLFSPTGVTIGDSQNVEINVHADWETIGLSILGVAIGALLVIGLIRTVLARRRRRAGAGSTLDDDAEGTT